MWEAELGGTRVTGSADFFALGGDSLSAVRVIYRLRSELGLQVRMSALQETPMLRDFVAGLSQDAGGPPAAGAEHVAIVSEPDRRHEPFPLTDQQQAYVLGRGDDFASGRVACHVYVEYRAVPGRTVELDRLNRAWQQVIDRHDALRIVIDPETMTQRVLTDVPELQVETVTGEHAAAQVRERLSHEVRDPAVWPLFAVVAELDDDRRVRRLMLSVDALISDFRGLRVMLDDLETFYRGTPLEPLDVTFRDYVLAARALDDGPAGVAGAAYWAERVHDLPDGPRLPMIAAADDLAKPRFVARHHRLSAERWAAVRDRAAAWGVTSTAVLVGCYAATLARWSETGHFTLNIPNFNRLPLHGQVDHLIGEFATFVLLEVTVDPDEPFADFCRRIQRRLWDDMDAGRRSGVSVLRDVAAVRGGLDSPFAPVVLTSEVAIDGGEHDAVLDGALIEDYAVTQTPQVWMDMRIEERAGVLRVNWDVMDELFPSGLPDELFAHFTGTLDAVASGATPADVTGDGVVDAELHGPSAPAAALAHSRILDAMRADPRAPLVDDGDRVWSRGEIGMAACRVTGRLRAAGVGRSDLVAVILDRGAAQFAAVYGVLGAGATYVPVDPDLPADRIRSILDAAGPAAVLHDRRSGPQPGVDSIAIEELVEGQRPEPGTLESWLDSAASAASPTDRAYVLFTSGSTGKPKGVMVRHDALSACVDATIGRFGLNADTRSLAVSALHHDMSVFDFFVVPAAGGAAVTVDHGLRRDPIHWAERSAEGGAGALCAVPAMVTMLCDGLVHEPVAAAGLRLVLTGGDRVSPQLVTRLRASSPEIVVASIGGPTETTAWNIWHVVQADAAVPEPVPYGTPIAGTSYRIVDDHGRTRPRWVTGEMEVSGVSVADGYLGGRRPDAGGVRGARRCPDVPYR
ncbi:AMP-binding protein [Gordonia humi]|uniref:AMP-binding protein n=1 Tax=Gordonia humi TaxID=686429 RepID=UPI00361F5849